ncbi:uncharacterized protein LOC117182545 [Belonocnema kinseyi]|uniref:uncharacterized protein LOC117182545 n=1 Tax=Belonocnema kinseyi TaxID=2817044 RepID=UPI00143D3D33|nr:uncharacterized protein LOC117182545 [Belonocnema kinseyi]
MLGYIRFLNLIQKKARTTSLLEIYDSKIHSPEEEFQHHQRRALPHHTDPHPPRLPNLCPYYHLLLTQLSDFVIVHLHLSLLSLVYAEHEIHILLTLSSILPIWIPK